MRRWMSAGAYGPCFALGFWGGVLIAVCPVAGLRAEGDATEPGSKPPAVVESAARGTHVRARLDVSGELEIGRAHV